MRLIIFFVFFSLLSNLVNAHGHDDVKDSVSESVIDEHHVNGIIDEPGQVQEIESINYFPNYHPLVVHFPIVLLIIASLIQLIFLFTNKKEFGWIVLLLLCLGVIATWLSSNTFHAHPEKLTGRAQEIFRVHLQMANMTFWISLSALLLKIVTQFQIKRKIILESLIAIMLLASATTVSIAGHHGAMLVHMEGVGPMGKHLESHHEHHDDDHDSDTGEEK